MSTKAKHANTILKRLVDNTLNPHKMLNAEDVLDWLNAIEHKLDLKWTHNEIINYFSYAEDFSDLSTDIACMHMHRIYDTVQERLSIQS